MEKENKNEEQKIEQENYITMGISLGMCFGIAIGIVIGIIINKIAICMCFGVSIGMGIGMVIGSLIKKEDKKTIKRYGVTKMFFAPPIYYDELMKKVPKGKLIAVICGDDNIWRNG